MKRQKRFRGQHDFAFPGEIRAHGACAGTGRRTNSRSFAATRRAANHSARARGAAHDQEVPRGMRAHVSYGQPEIQRNLFDRGA